MKKVCALALWMLFGVAACGGGPAAPTMPDGSKIAIMIVPDRGIQPDFNEGQIERRNQVGAWMEADLVKMLEKQGYAPALIQDPSQIQAGPGRYLLRVKITNYNPGSKAARMFGGVVGGIAGKCVLDTHYELVSQSGVMTSGDPKVASTRDWNYSAREVNRQTVSAITNRFRQGLN